MGRVYFRKPRGSDGGLNCLPRKEFSPNPLNTPISVIPHSLAMDPKMNPQTTFMLILSGIVLIIGVHNLRDKYYLTESKCVLKKGE